MKRRMMVSRRIAMVLILGGACALMPCALLAQAETATAAIERGIQLLRGKDSVAAKMQFSEAVKADPHSADALTWRGVAENQLKQYAEAVRDFQTALRLDPNEMSAHYNLSLSYIRLGRVDDASAQLEIVVQAHPGVVEPEYNLAVLLESKKATAEAVEHLQAAYQTQPGDLGVTQHLLLDLLALERTAEAQPIIESLQSNAPPPALQQMGTALLEAKQFPQAMQLLDSARSRTGEGRELDLLLARACIGAQELTRAIDLLQPHVEGDSTGEAAYLLGLAYTGTGQASEARDAFARAVASNPHNDGALYHLGLMESATSDQQAKGVQHLREAVRLDPGNTAYALGLARALLEQDKPQDALTVISRAHPEGGALAERDLLLGIGELGTAGAGQAIPTLERTATEAPGTALAYNLLGFCYFSQGDYAKAAGYYQKGSDLLPENVIFAHDAAMAFDRANDSGQAMVYASRAVASAGAGGEDHYLVGKLLAKTGKNEDAVRELKTAVQLSPDLDGPYYLLARTSMRMGDTAQATEWNARLAELKQKHDRDYALKKAADRKDKPVPSSTLLQGAPMTDAEQEAP
jgi:tetratricopeptide (TPR) repeat protein